MNRYGSSRLSKEISADHTSNGWSWAAPFEPIHCRVVAPSVPVIEDDDVKRALDGRFSEAVSRSPAAFAPLRTRRKILGPYFLYYVRNHQRTWPGLVDAFFGRERTMKRASYIARGLVGILITATPVVAPANEDLELREIAYASWMKPQFGDRLPVGGPVIRVYSEGRDRFKFIGHTNEPVRFLGLLSGSCGKDEEISSLEFEVAGQKVSLSHPDGEGAWFSRTGVVELSRSEPQGFHAVRECNAKLKALADRTGRPRSELVADGFGIRFRNWIEGQATLTCGGRNNIESVSARLDIWVQCGGHPGPDDPIANSGGPVPAELSPLVTDLTFEVDNPSYVGKCPVGLQFTGSITTSRAGYVQYRSIADDGRTSPTDTLRFAKAGTQTITIWNETFSETRSGFSPAAAENSGPTYKGWRRLEIIEPAGFAPSSNVDFSVTCQE